MFFNVFFLEPSRFPSVNPVESPSASLVDSATASPRAASITTACSLHNRNQSPQFYAGIIFLLYIKVM